MRDLYLIYRVCLLFCFFSVQGSFLAVPHNGSRSESGVENVVYCFLDLFTDHQVSVYNIVVHMKLNFRSVPDLFFDLTELEWNEFCYLRLIPLIN